MPGKFEIKKAKNGQFFFHLMASNGEIILASEQYKAKPSCKNGIASVQRNAGNDARYERKTGKSGKFFFVLKAGNHEIIGNSEQYDTEKNRDKGIESVKKNAPDAKVVDLTAATARTSGGIGLMTVRREESGHQDAIRHIVREAFASEEEAVLVDRLRADGHVLLSLVAEVDGIAVGHILFPRMWIVTASGRHNTVALAPLAVLPSHQRSGVGSALVREGLRQLQAMGERAVLVLGHADYYPRFGFSRDCITTLESPFPRESFFGLELTPGALRGISGRVEYPPAFGL